MKLYAGSENVAFDIKSQNISLRSLIINVVVGGGGYLQTRTLPLTTSSIKCVFSGVNSQAGQGGK